MKLFFFYSYPRVPTLEASAIIYFSFFSFQHLEIGNLGFYFFFSATVRERTKTFYVNYTTKLDSEQRATYQEATFFFRIQQSLFQQLWFNGRRTGQDLWRWEFSLMSFERSGTAVDKLAFCCTDFYGFGIDSVREVTRLSEMYRCKRNTWDQIQSSKSYKFYRAR